MGTEKKVKIVTIMWANWLPLLKEAADGLDIELVSYSTKLLNLYPDVRGAAAEAMRDADLILLYRTNDPFWEEIEDEVKDAGKRIPVVVVGSDPSFWSLSNVNPEIVAAVYRYLLFNGHGNIANMLRCLLHHFFQEAVAYGEPEEVPWQGVYHPGGHPGMDRLFLSTGAYLEEYERYLPTAPAAYIGLLYSRSNWATRNLEIEKRLVAAFEKRHIGVIPVFHYSLKDETLGNLAGVEVIEKYLLKDDGSPLVDGIVKLTSFFLGSSRGANDAERAPAGAELLKRLNVPLFGPVISYYKNREEWLDDPQGLGSQAAWSIAMPEFEGIIEPPIEDRIERLATRIVAWVRLRKKPNSEKNIAFILHNNPCASVEATVGAGAHLDTLESVAGLLQRMAREGYRVNPPANGKALIDEIMARKAVSEFRWTTVEEIVAKKGALALVGPDRYGAWFAALPEKTRRRMSEAWGNPPGEEKDGVPAAMVHDGKIVVTGIDCGHAVVCVQPKRGCAGATCDGQVCRILHDPDVPPPHQYVATYQWLSREFGADALIHVGTHGNLEFLPGKSVGMSSGCFPDIGIDAMPHLYIYNSDNPPEGTVAKRRSHAVLVDHLQTVMVKGELYGDLEQLEKLLEEYARYHASEPGRAHTIAHLITDKVKSLQLLDCCDDSLHDRFGERVREIHDRLSLLKSTYIPKGMHVFGRLPEGDKLAAFVHAVARFDNAPGSLRGVVAGIARRELSLDGDALDEKIEEISERICRGFVLDGVPLAQGFRDCVIMPIPSFRASEARPGIHDLQLRLDARLRGHDNDGENLRVATQSLNRDFKITAEDAEVLRNVESGIEQILRNVLASDETGALLNGLNGGFIEPGPSGLVTRGRSDVLPTGRNFYSLDPQRIPSPAAWETGKILAEKTIEKYRSDEGRLPENIAFHWQCTDIMWADGEGMAQMLSLLGVRPIWRDNGRTGGFRIIPLEELGRPRIDITVRVSGITRDNFPGAIALLDEAVQAVASLDEPSDLNFVRKHTLEKLEGKAEADRDILRKATYRIFASMPGTYQAGTQLAVYASAWKTQEDLSDVFLYWNGYAYGKGAFGEPAHGSLKASLKTVDVTFNKTVTDEYDLTGCCCYFGTHGGMINAARVISGNDIRNYYGDTREPGKVAVRTLTEEMRRIARAKILNPQWIEGMKEHGYKGAGEIGKRVGRLYGWQATARAVDDAVFDDVARTFMMDDENRAFFEENNPWALEEMARRLIEAAERGLWNPSPDVRDALKNLYVEIEGWIEERMGDMKGDFQGGSIDIFTKEEVAAWKSKMEEILG
ncbi:MAG: Aerobic cobaltochelatase subunit CobN [Syntrophaceae bacterium PtaU1.Bin231]|nr:MAG: Aerobic cobaltochelatase subunit CobN [Syntrophaceae bacterium PtaU1.Bin231]